MIELCGLSIIKLSKIEKLNIFNLLLIKISIFIPPSFKYLDYAALLSCLLDTLPLSSAISLCIPYEKCAYTFPIPLFLLQLKTY